MVYNSYRESKIGKNKEVKTMWKIFCRKMETEFREEFYAIFVPNDKWKFSWCLDYEGNFTGEYWDNDKGSRLNVHWKKFDTGDEAAKYVFEIINKKAYLLSDVTKFYLDDVFYQNLK